MRYRVWTFNLDDGPHRVELQHGYWSGTRLIRADGKVIEKTGWLRKLDTGSKHAFELGEHECEIKIGFLWELGIGYTLLVNGQVVRNIKKRQPEESYLVEIVEEKYIEEPREEEKRVIDNLRSSVAVTRKLSFSKEWLQSYRIDSENIHASKIEGDTKLGPFGGVKIVAEEKVRQQYSISESIRKTQNEEVTIEIPPETKVSVSIQWKHLVRTGLVKVSSHFGESFELPFRVTVGITFDQTQTDG